VATIEVCTTVLGNTECVSDKYLLAALAVELAVYFVIFVIGHRIVVWIKNELKK